MIVKPYARTPRPPTVAMLSHDGTIQSERDGALEFDDWPSDTRCFATFDTIRSLLKQGIGEAVCWNGEEIHWRHQQLDDEGWKPRPSDVHVLKVEQPASRYGLLDALVDWRDWLRTFGAAPTGTTGSAAWSLLRATLDQPLYTGEPFQQTPRVPWTIGGRQELGPHGAGGYDGRLELWDMPQAYASELGRLPYGGYWMTGSDHGSLDPEWWSQGGRRAVFVWGTVRMIPEMRYGPLPRRPRRKPRGMAGMLGCEYPVGCDLTGTWTWEEVRAALSVGCRLVKTREVWFHCASRLPFAVWFDAVQDGRRMRNPLAAQLAKMTGNALWGRFCMDARDGTRTIRSMGAKRMVARPLVMRGGQPPAHDLAETISGRIRARLYSKMMEVGDGLLSAHTDGLWLRHQGVAGVAPERTGERRRGRQAEGSTSPPDAGQESWRLKQRASRLELLGPQTLRYWPRHAHHPVAVVAGVPAGESMAWFDAEWARYPWTAAAA